MAKRYSKLAPLLLLWHIVTISALLQVASAYAQVPASQKRITKQAGKQGALTPAMLFQEVAPSVFVIQVHDDNGNIVGRASAVAVVSPPRPSTVDDLAAALKSSRQRPPETIEDLRQNMWDGWRGRWQQKFPSSTIFVTGGHVVASARTLTLVKGDHLWPASVVGIDSDHDLALVRADNLDAPAAVISFRTDLPCPDTIPCEYGLTVGEHVYAVGAPLGLELTLSDGLISGLRGGLTNNRLIQTTAAVSHGSSGGGLFDADGALVGIISSSISDGQNLNFAIPIDWVRFLRPE